MARGKRTARRRAGGRRRRRRSARVARALTAAVAALVLCAVAGVAWLLLVYPKRHGPGPGRATHVDLVAGESMSQVARALREAGAIEHPELFAIYGRLVGASGHLRRGHIVLTDELTPAGVLPHIARGFGPAWIRVPIPEGFTRFDIAHRLQDWGITDADGFLRVTGSAEVAHSLGVGGDTLEGYLFPATYELAKGTAPLEIAREMVDTWRRRVLPVVEQNADGLAKLQHELGWSLYDVLTLASIVEKEAAASDERPIIAGVFLNRLRDPSFEPKRLQADPTVTYGCLAVPSAPSCAGYDGHITAAMLHGSHNPYNTYRIEGLPPGPIANPGLDSIRAVLAPAQHDFLYFVAKGGGHHHFSATLNEHIAAVSRYQHAN